MKFTQQSHPERRDYASFADFTDPDGNSRTLQERGYDNYREGNE